MDKQPKVVGFPRFKRPVVAVTLWERRERPSEDVLRESLAADGYLAVRWSNEAATGYPPHAHVYPELIWVVAGNLTLVLPADGRLIELGPGDRAEIPQGLPHGTMAGAEGATYLLATR